MRRDIKELELGVERRLGDIIKWLAAMLVTQAAAFINLLQLPSCGTNTY